MAHSALYAVCFAITPQRLLLGFGGANGRTGHPFAPLSWLAAPLIAACARRAGHIAFFCLFSSTPLDRAFEYLRHKVNAPTGINRSVRAVDFLGLSGRQMPLGNSAQNGVPTRPLWLFFFPRRTDLRAIVFAPLPANVLYGADARRAAGADRNRPKLRHVAAPRPSGVIPLCHTMGVYAWPGLANSVDGADQGDPLLFLLGNRRHRGTAAA